MHKRGFMLAIGIPLAREHDAHDEHDEDSLDREPEYGRGDDRGDEQRPHDALSEIYRGLCDGDEQMRDVALTLGSCLRRMAKAQDHDELEHWYEKCCKLVDALDGDDSDGGDDGRDNREDDRDE
jgi:hypothetical protein